MINEVGGGFWGAAFIEVAARSDTNQRRAGHPPGDGVGFIDGTNPDREIDPILHHVAHEIRENEIDLKKADIILLALPFAAIETFGRTKDQWRGKIVIDATSAYHVPPGYLAGRLSSDVVAAALPGAAVVKAFNHLPAAVLARDPSQNGGRRVVFISSNDDDAANEVKILAERLGFSPIPLGRIDEGGRLLQIDGGLILHNLVEWPFK
jgi:predicted dinucleotide-binding enzyme